MAKCSVADSKNVLDEADLVVVFLSQKETEIQNFFERFSSLIPKVLFIIVDYQRDSGYSCRRIKEKYGITPRQVIEMKSIMGDTSDNIPGVKGIGEKGALKLITEYGNLDNIYANIDLVT